MCFDQQPPQPRGHQVLPLPPTSPADSAADSGGRGRGRGEGGRGAATRLLHGEAAVAHVLLDDALTAALAVAGPRRPQQRAQQHHVVRHQGGLAHAFGSEEVEGVRERVGDGLRAPVEPHLQQAPVGPTERRHGGHSVAQPLLAEGQPLLR